MPFPPPLRSFPLTTTGARYVGPPGSIPGGPQVARRTTARRPRWCVHYTPASASWLNQVERFFADLTEKQIRRGVHRSTVELEQAIAEYIEAVNEDPKPFRWHKSADEILACIKRFCLRTLELAPAHNCANFGIRM